MKTEEEILNEIAFHMEASAKAIENKDAVEAARCNAKAKALLWVIGGIEEL